MGVGAEAYIGLALPILQIVDRLAAGAREVGNLVAIDAVRAKPGDRCFVEVRDAVVRWHVGSAVAFAAQPDFSAQAAVVIDLQHVDGNMRRVEGDRRRERVIPTGFGLPREAGDEVDIDVPEAPGAKQGDILHDGLRGVLPAGSREFLSNERLHSEAYAIDAGAQPRVDSLGGDGTGRRLDRCLAPWTWH